MPIATDPAFLLVYGMDESLATANRANAGSLGSVQDLVVEQSLGTDGVQPVSDGNGGKALDLFIVRSPFTTATRRLKGPSALGSVHTCRPALPLNSASDDWAFGTRFQYKGLNTGGGAIETEFIFGLASLDGTAVYLWKLEAEPDSAAAPTAARLILGGGVGAFPNEAVVAAGYTVTGGAPAHCLIVGRWYRVAVRFFNTGAGTYKVKVYVYEESTGTTYTFTRISNLSSNYSGTDNTTAFRVAVSGYDASNPFPFGGYIDACWLYDAPLSDGDATTIVTGGISVPWTPPSRYRAPHVVHAAVAKEGASFPPARALPTGVLAPLPYPVDVFATRPRLLFEGWRPARPWALRRATVLFDTVGPFSSKDSNVVVYKDLGIGLVRRPGELPLGAAEYARDLDFYPEGPRRRLGFKSRRIVATDVESGAANLFHFFRTNDDALHGLFKVGTKLYAETGAAAAQLDTGWNLFQMPSVFFLGNRLHVLTSDRQKAWNGDPTAVQSFGVVAPPSCTPALAAGTLTGAYYWAVTEYDPTTGDESGPTHSAIANPVAQGVTLTLGAVSSDTRFSKRRIYRTVNGGTAPNLFLVVEIATATTYTDAGLADGTTPIPRVVQTDNDGNVTLLGYITGVPPDTFSIGVAHSERAFYSGGSSHPERVYPAAVANSPQQFYSGQYLTCSGPVRLLASIGHRLVAFTDNTTEVFESDWIRDADGVFNYVRTVVSKKCGALGVAAGVNAEEGGFFWADRRGIFTWGPDGKPKCVSDAIEDLFPYMNHGIARRVCGSYNHFRKQIGFCVPMASTEFQVDNTRFQTWLCAHVARPDRWFTRNLEASYHGQFDDDLNGMRFGAIDHLGVFKELESYECDGPAGNDAFTIEDEGGTSLGISTIVGSVVTVVGAPGWTSAALRGYAVVFRDRSTGINYWHPVSTNGTNTLTVVGTPNALLAAGDGWYLGAIDARIRLAEHGYDSPNDKIVRQLRPEFADSDGSLYL